MNQILSLPRKMPIGIQSFEYIRQNDFVYVDKTEFVYRLATMGSPISSAALGALVKVCCFPRWRPIS